MPADYFEEEEFQTRFDGRTFLRILGLTRPHRKWVTGFLLTLMVVSGLDAFFTYLSKEIIDLGIVARNSSALSAPRPTSTRSRPSTRASAWPPCSTRSGSSRPNSRTPCP